MKDKKMTTMHLLLKAFGSCFFARMAARRCIKGYTVKKVVHHAE